MEKIKSFLEVIMKKDAIIRIRMEREEYETLKKSSEPFSLSEYVRLILTSEHAKLKFTKAEKKEYITQLRKIGVNINQIAKKINGGIYTIEDKVFLNSSLEEILKLIRKINKEA